MVDQTVIYTGSILDLMEVWFFEEFLAEDSTYIKYTKNKDFERH